ncbi:microtubule-actin cross-linking factor 1-like isoform X5 [Lampetra fluviatilis]
MGNTCGCVREQKEELVVDPSKAPLDFDPAKDKDSSNRKRWKKWSKRQASSVKSQLSQDLDPQAREAETPTQAFHPWQVGDVSNRSILPAENIDHVDMGMLKNPIVYPAERELAGYGREAEAIKKTLPMSGRDNSHLENCSSNNCVIEPTGGSELCRQEKLKPDSVSADRGSAEHVNNRFTTHESGSPSLQRDNEDDRIRPASSSVLASSSSEDKVDSNAPGLFRSGSAVFEQPVTDGLATDKRATVLVSHEHVSSELVDNGSGDASDLGEDDNPASADFERHLTFSCDEVLHINEDSLQDDETVGDLPSAAAGWARGQRVDDKARPREEGALKPVNSPSVVGKPASGINDSDHGGEVCQRHIHQSDVIKAVHRQEISEIQVTGQSEDMSAKEKLLLWSQRMVEVYPAASCQNFSTAWRDGHLFNAIIHRHRPDLVDMEKVNIQSNRENLAQAFALAEKELGVTSLLDPEDIDVVSPDEKSIITYVSSLYDAMPVVPDVFNGISADEADLKWSEYQEMVKSLLLWISRQIEIMEDRTFPDDLEQLNALYAQFTHLKNTEFTTRLSEKHRIHELYKTLEGWFQSGRIKLPEKSHPNDVEREWSRLFKAMGERETTLRFEIARLEALQRLARTAEMDTSQCGDLLAKASSALQADSSRISSGQQPQSMAEIAQYLTETEVKISKLFVDIQSLREAKYLHSEQLYSRVLQLHEQLTSMRAEQGKLLGRVQQLLEDKARDAAASRAADAERVRTEDDSNLKYAHELLAWVEHSQLQIDSGDWGSDLPSVEANMESHKTLHRSIEDFRSSVEEATANKSKLSSTVKAEYIGLVNSLEIKYTKLMNASRSRGRHLDSLHSFITRATKELIWLNQKEEDEVSYDWSEKNSSTAVKKEAYGEFMRELEERESNIKSIQESGEQLLADAHPGKQSIQAYIAAMQTQWNWVLQLCSCVETHLAENTAYFQFFQDAKEVEQQLNNLQDTIWRKYKCDKSTSLTRLENLLQDAIEEKEQLSSYKSRVNNLASRAKTVVQLKPRNPDSFLHGTIPIRAICDYKQLEITLHKNAECVLEDNSQRSRWKVISSSGSEAMVPSVCFSVPAPNREAIDLASRLEQLYHDIGTLWHQLYTNMQSVLSWHYFVSDIDVIRSWNTNMFRNISPEEHANVMHDLTVHYEEFLKNSRESEVFTPSELSQLERDFNFCRQHYEELLLTVEKEDQDETACRSLIAELQGVQQRLESCEERMVRMIRTPLDQDALQDNANRISEQERLHGDVEEVKAGLQRTSASCESVLGQSVAVPSQTQLRSEHAVTLQRMDQVYCLSSVYLEKLKTVDLVIKSVQDAEILVKTFETRLCEEERVPTDPQEIQRYKTILKQWRTEVDQQQDLFHSLEDEVQRARAVNEHMFRAHSERGPDVDRFKERADQLCERWHSVHSQIDARARELEGLQKQLGYYTETYVWLDSFVQDATGLQESLQSAKATDSRSLTEQLHQQQNLVVELEKNLPKLNECQEYSSQFCTGVKDYEMQLMTYRAMAEKAPVRKRMLQSSADVTGQQFMELRNRYSSQITLARQNEKFIGDTLRRAREDETSLEQSREGHLSKVDELLSWVSGIGENLQSRRAQSSGLSPDSELLDQSCNEQQSLVDQLSSQKDAVAEAIRQTELFLAQNGSKLSEEQKAEIQAKLDNLKQTYQQLCEQSAEELQQLHKEAQRKQVLEVRQQECSQKLSDLESWLDEASSGLSTQDNLHELDDLQQQQLQHQMLQRDLATRAGEMEEMVRSTQHFLDENRERLDPEFVAAVEKKLADAKSKLGELQAEAQAKQRQLDASVSTAIKQKTEKLAAAEQLEENKDKIDQLLGWLSSLEEPQDEVDSRSAISEHDAMKAYHQQVLAQQQGFLIAAQQSQAFLDKHGASLPPDEREKLERNLANLRDRFEATLALADGKWRLVQEMQDDAGKFGGECDEFEGWLDQAEGDMGELGRSASDPESLRSVRRRHGSFSDDVVSHKGDLRYLSRSGQKVLGAIKAYEELCAKVTDGPSGPSFNTDAIAITVKDRLQQVNGRFGTLRAQCDDLGSQLVDRQEKYKHYQEASSELVPWLQQAELAADKLKSDPVAATADGLQRQLEEAKKLKEDVTAHKTAMQRFTRATEALLATTGEPLTNQQEIQNTLDDATRRYEELSRSSAEHGERLEAALEQSVSLQDGLEKMLQWLEEAERQVEEEASGPVTSHSVRQMMTDNESLQEELKRKRGRMASMREKIEGLLATADPVTAADLKEKLRRLEERFETLDGRCQDKDANLGGLAKKMEVVERATERMGSLMAPGEKGFNMVDGGGGMDFSEMSRDVKWRSSELSAESEKMEELQKLAKELAEMEPSAARDQMLEKINGILAEWHQLQEEIREREATVASFQLQLDEFRVLVESLRQWLTETEGRVPSDASTGAAGSLQDHVQLVQSLLVEWEAKGPNVDDVKKQAEELEKLLATMVSADAVTESQVKSGSIPSSSPSVNGHSTSKELATIQSDVSDVSGRYDELGHALRDRERAAASALERVEQVRGDADSLMGWLAGKLQDVSGWSGAPSEGSAIKSEAERNKLLLSEIENNLPKVQALRQQLRELLEKNPDSPEADKWRSMLKELDDQWAAVHQSASERQQQLEESCGLLETFRSLESQLSQWLMEKQLMMSVLGPLSIDPNMLANQKQQVQFMLKEFEARRPQYDQLNQAAQGILGKGGENREANERVAEQHAAVNDTWGDITGQLSSRSDRIDKALETSATYADALRELSDKVSDLGAKLSKQGPLSTQPEVVKRQLEEAGEIAGEIELQKDQLEEAEYLCQELSDLVQEPYLQTEIRRRLGSVMVPFKELEERAGDRMNQLQTALASSQQFQQMFDELRGWLDEQRGEQATMPPISAKIDQLQAQLQQQSDFLKSLNQHAGTYHVVVAEGEALLQATQPGAEKTALQTQLASLKEHWEDLMKQAGDRHHRLQDALKKAQHYKQLADELRPWVEDSEGKLTAIDKVSIDQTEVDRQLAGGKAMRQDVQRRHSMLEALNTAADNFIDSCQVDEEMIRDEKAELNQRMDNLTENVLLRVEGLEEMAQRLKEFHDSQKDIQKKLDDAGQQISSHDAMGNQAFNNKQLEKMKAYHEGMEALAPQVDYMHNFALGLVADASEGSDTSSVVQLAEETRSSFDSALAGITERCSVLDGRLQGVNRFQGHVRELFTSLTDLDDELDTMGPTARDVDTLQCQLEDLGSIQEKLQNLRDEIRKAGEGCTKMQENESGMDLQGVKREVETLKKQSGRLADRTDTRQAELQETLAQVEDFHHKIQVLSQQLQSAEATEDGQGPVAAELELINQQMETFQSFQKGEVEPLQVSVQELNTLGHGLVQSAAKSVATQGLEHELEETNACWNTLNKKVAERAVQLQRALLHCGKFQDALESLLSWLADTEELIANQKPPSAEYKVVKAQIQEQKLLALLLDDRKHSIEVIRKEGQQIADSADAPDKEKILKQLSSLGRRWEALTSKADARQKQLEGILVVAQQFHETLEPLSEWLSGTEKKLSNLEPIGTQAVKIQQQISQHKSLEEDVNARSKPLHQLLGLGQALKASSGGGEREAVQVQLEQVQARYLETAERARRRGELLGQALAHARLFGDDEVELLNWLAEAQDRLADMSPSDHQPDVLQAQHDEHLSLHEEIVSRKQTVDQAIKNGQNLLKQTTGDEILTIQEKLDGIKSRYAEITGSSTRALKSLEKALHLATKFHGTHRELNEWLGHAESEMATCDTRLAVGEQLTAMQDRVNTLHKDVMERRLTLDTVNEVSSALLELVPWRAREGLDRLVADDNARYRVVSDAVARKTDELDAAVQRSQQFEQTADNELAWVAETERKLRALGDVSLEQDTTTSQLQVQKAFTIDILRHKDSIDQLVKNGDELKVSCSEEEKAAMESKLASLLERYDVVSRLNTARLSQLERAQLLSTQFWEIYEELMPWLVETRESLGHLPPPSIEQETLRQQQEELRQLRESIAEHKPYVDKLKKIGPQLEELSLSEGPALREKYTGAERLFEAIREDVRQRALGLDEALSQSSQFHDKMDVMLEGLGRIIERLRMPPPIPAEAEKIKEQLAENKNIALELEKLQPMFNLLKESGEELVGLSGGAEKELNAKAIKDKLGQMLSLWEEIQSRSEERENRLLDVLDLAERFWTDLGTMLATLKETREYMQDLEELGVDPSLIKQQEEYMLANKNDIDGFQEDLEILRYLGTNLISACGEPDKPEVKKSIDEMNSSWDRLNKCWKDRMDKLEEAMKTAMQYQDALQSMFDWVENATTEMENLPPVGTDLETVKRQMEDLKQLKTESYQQQIEMERLSHQGELMLKRVKEEENRMVIAGPLRDLKEQWETLDTKILSRQHKMEAALLALGQFQHALDELLTWLEHTEGLLDEQKPVANEPKAIEIELAKHHVLRNDVLAHQSTVGTVQRAGQDLVLSSSGAEASGLQGRLDDLAARWESVLSCTEQRQAQLEGSLRKAQGFQGEMDGLLQWLSDMENQLSDTKPVGGLPETAKEQLSTHMEMCEEYRVKHGLYTKVLEQCQRMQNEQSGEPTLKYGIQDLEHKWKIVGNKLNERRAKLETALKTAIEFHNSLQDFIGWLTQMENNLNTLSPASLILDSVLFQIDEHKMLANEVNTHREQIIELDKTGTHLKYFSQKQDVALIKNLLLSVQARWEHIMQSTLERGRSLDDARKRAKQFHESWTKLMDWLEGAEKGLDHELDCGNDPERIKLMLGRHKDIQKSLGAKQPIYDSTTRTGRTLKERATLVDDDQRLDNMLSELRDKWDTICGKSVERQHKLEEALLFSGQFAEALQVLIDWLYKVEPHLAEDQPVHGDVALVMTLIDAHKVFQRELGKRASSVNALKRSARDLLDSSKSDASWVRAQMAELSARWDTVCKLSVSKQARLDDALKQAEVFRTLVQSIMDVLAEAEKTLRFHGTLPDDEDSLRLLISQHKEFTERLEAQRSEVIRAVSMGEAILAVCHPDSASAIKQWINIIRTRFEEVMTWARQHQTRLEAALSELVSNSQLLEEMLAWLQKAQEMLAQRDQETLPEQIESLHYLISEHQGFMEEMMSKQPEMEQMTKSYKRKPSESHALFDRTRGSTRKRGGPQSTAPASPSQPLETKNPRITLLFNRWRQVWLVALERQRKLQDALERLQELKEFENFDFDVWRKRYMQWMNHKKSRVMDFFRRMDKDQDGKITRQEFIDGILSSRFPTNRLEMTAVADIFDRDGDGYIDYYEFIAALHPNKDAYRPITDADKIEDEVTRQVAACKCTRRFQVEQIGENKYRFYLGNQFGDSQQLRLVRILRSTVMVRVGGGWMALDEFLVKNDPCRAKGRTNLELREKFILPEGASQSMTPFRMRGKRSRPSSRTASPTRAGFAHSHGHGHAYTPTHNSGSCATPPSSGSSNTPSTPRQPSALSLSRNYDKPWLVNSKTSTPARPIGQDCESPPFEVTPVQGSRLRPPGYLSGKSLHTGDDSLTSDSASETHPPCTLADSSRSPSRTSSALGSRPGSRTGSRRGSESSELDASERSILQSDGEPRPASRTGARQTPKGSKIPTTNSATKLGGPASSSASSASKGARR